MFENAILGYFCQPLVTHLPSTNVNLLNHSLSIFQKHACMGHLREPINLQTSSMHFSQQIILSVIKIQELKGTIHRAM